MHFFSNTSKKPTLSNKFETVDRVSSVVVSLNSMVEVRNVMLIVEMFVHFFIIFTMEHATYVHVLSLVTIRHLSKIQGQHIHSFIRQSQAKKKKNNEL